MLIAEQTLSPQSELVDFLLTRPTPKQIIAFKLSDAAREYASELLARNRESQLSREERADLDQFLQLEILCGLLKAKARLMVKKHNG
jgi:hypothetical protein